MPRRDEIDATLAKHFAWAFARPEDSAAELLERFRVDEVAAAGGSGWGRATEVEVGVAASEAAAAQGDVVGPGGSRADGVASERSRAKAQAGCRSLAASIADAWSRREEATCLQATKRLLARADRLGVALLEMREWPMEAARLLRLLVRFAPKLTRRQRERSASVATLVPLDHAEAAELLVEVARAGDRVMADALLADDEWSPEVEDVDALVGRLADVVNAGPAHASRVVAIELIARVEARTGATDALRRALTLPCFGVRAHALHALATARPCAVRLEDLVRVLQDLVTHAVPDALSHDEHEDHERIFAEAVILALEHVRPENASTGALGRGRDLEDAPPTPSRRGPTLDEVAEALLDWIDAEHEALWLDAGWATEALAVAFPETAAAMVDHWLKCARAYDRSKALAALERLPPKLARPRIALAGSDPAPSVREPARQQWLRRFGGACPSEVQTLVGAGLLAGPPSERFASRLLVMQGRVAEARLGMARALVAEAPDPEALVLLLQLVGDDAASNEPLATHAGPDGAPAPDTEWAALLVQKFGPRGVEGLCALAARFPEPESFAWMRRLGDLVERGIIRREHAAPLRTLASAHVAADDAGAVDDSIRLLALVGAPPELLDRAVGLALDADLVSSAVRDLLLAWPDRVVDARLASEMALAVAERDWDRVQCAASVALGRGAPAARVIAQRVLEIAEDDEAAVDAAIECAHRLRALKALDDGWALAALGRPQSPVFAVAARVWRRSSAVRGALEAALVSPARGGASRAEAAIALLWAEPPLSARDRRLAAVLAGAPPPERAELVHAMCVQGAPLAQVAGHLEELLASSDPTVTSALVGIAYWLKSPKAQALLREVIARVVDAELRAEIEEELGTADRPYWVEG